MNTLQTMPQAHSSCALCNTPGGELIWQESLCRVVRVEDADYPGFCRVILNRHVMEMTDLSQEDRERLMHVVFAVESAVRKILRPDKVNLASLGNMTPHVHWHVIPRFRRDRHFPQAIWAPSQRETLAHPLDTATANRLKQEIQRMLE